MEKLVVIRTLSQFEELFKYLESQEYIAFDTETNGVDKSSKIIGMSVCSDPDVGYYVILSEWDAQKELLVDLETKGRAKEFCQALVGHNLIMQNAVFDCSMVKNNFNVELMPSVHTDTMILGHLLDENRKNGLKELGAAIFGEDARKEQKEMHESVHRNGGSLTKDKYELYKADSQLLAMYGAKDAVLTLKLFYHFVPQLIEEGLDKFFYDEESMPQLRGPTYDLNTSGLRVDPEKLQTLRLQLQSECLEDRNFINQEVWPHVRDKYPGDKKTNHFNINANQQLSWLLFFNLGNMFNTLTDSGKEVCQALDIKVPYTVAAKKGFVALVEANKGMVFVPKGWVPKRDAEGITTWWNPDTKRVVKRPKKIGDPWSYTQCGKETLGLLAQKYEWVDRLLKYKMNEKLLNTYVMGIQDRMKYNIIRPSFLQHGTTSGRYSSKMPNFQNLPRKDKRIKSCIVSRQGKVFVGADYSQLEPRVFASFSGDKRLQEAFKGEDDFYSVIGMEVFDKTDCVPRKDGHPEAFGLKYPALRDIAKVVALSATYGTTAPKMALSIGKSKEEAQYVIDSYFDKFPSVLKLMLESHEYAKKNGQVENLFGRPRRMPAAKDIKGIFGNTSHAGLPYDIRNVLNLAVNHRIQSTGASIMNRAAIAFVKRRNELKALNPLWAEVHLVLQVHDELILEGPEEIAQEMVKELKHCMEHTVVLPGVKLEAEPKIAKDLASLK